MTHGFNIKVPWWARLIGWWKRRQFEKRDRAEKLRLQKVPVYMGTVFAQTEWIDAKPQPYTSNTYRWDLFETPDGERSVRCIDLHPYRKSADGSYHDRHRYITMWLNHKWDFSWDDVRQGEVKGWYR